MKVNFELHNFQLVKKCSLLLILKPNSNSFLKIKINEEPFFENKSLITY